VSPVNRSRPPAAGERRPFRFPTFHRQRLSSGLELILAPRRRAPLVEALLLLPAGGERNPTRRPGLSALTAALLDEGTAQHSGLELALELERLGASLSTGADWESGQVALSVLARDLERGLERLAEVALTPTFPAPEVERLRAQWLAELHRRRDQPAALADEAFAAELFAGSPYRHLLRGNEAALRAVARDEIEEFHAGGYRPRGSCLIVGGGFDEAQLPAIVERFFGRWRPAGPEPPPRLDDGTERHRRVVIVDLPHATQTELRIGHPGVPRSDPDRTRLGLLNAVLGGKFTSRLNLNLRERHGYTYGVSSRFVDRRGRGPFLVATAVATEVAGAAAAEILGEIARLREEPVGAEELVESRDYLSGVFPYTLQTVHGVLARLADLAVHGLPDDHFERALEEIDATSADDLLELARRHLAPEGAAIVACGPAAQLRTRLEPFGEPRVLAVEELGTS
jgi:zinc protease